VWYKSTTSRNSAFKRESAQFNKHRCSLTSNCSHDPMAEFGTVSGTELLLASLFFSLEAINAQVVADTIQPSRKARLAAKICKAFIGVQKSFLSDMLRFTVIP